MDGLPKTGFLRLSQILIFIPVGKTCWWEGVKSGRYPQPVKLSPRCTAWVAEDIHELIRQISRREITGASFVNAVEDANRVKIDPDSRGGFADKFWNRVPTGQMPSDGPATFSSRIERNRAAVFKPKRQDDTRDKDCGNPTPTSSRSGKSR